jgi:hypothetical protein
VICVSETVLLEVDLRVDAAHALRAYPNNSVDLQG